MSDDWRNRVEADLAALDRQASTMLTDQEPAPEGLPPAGSWVRALRIDADARGIAEGPWHIIGGWDSHWDCISLRCRRKAGRAIQYGLWRYLGDRPEHRRSWWDRYTLLVQAKRPRGRLCRQCLTRLAADARRAEAEAQAARDAAILALVPAIEAIVNDPSLSDAQRGRRLRGLWASLEAQP